MNIYMDQQQLSTMDPKLREAYERIMGNTPAMSNLPTSNKQALPSTPAIDTTNPPLYTGPITPPTNQTPAAQAQSSNLTPPINKQQAQIDHIPQPHTDTSVNQNSSPPTPPPPPFMDPVVANNQMHAYVASEVAGVKQSLKIIQLMYLAGGLVFFAVYALFWMKFFNIPSPF